MFKRTGLTLLVLIVCLICSVSTVWASGSGEGVKVGALIPLTGPLSEFAYHFRLAGDLAVNQLTQAGFPVNVIYADTETKAIPGVQAARTLVDIERVVAIVGAAATGVTQPVAETVTIPGKIPQISNASTAPLLSVLPADEGKDFLFRTTASDALQGVVLGMLAAEEGYKKAAVLWINSAYGQGLLDQFTKSFELRGGTIVSSVPHDEASAPTYVSELKKLMEPDPDVMLCISYPGHATVYLKEFFEAGYNADCDLLFCDGTKSVEMPEALGAETLAGFYGTAAAALESRSYTAYKEGYTALFDAPPPLPYMDTFYDAVIIIGLAAAAAQAKGLPINGVNIRDNLRFVSNPPGELVYAGVDGLKTALSLIQAGKDVNYEGAAGSVNFMSTGDVATPIEIFQYIDKDPYIEQVRIVTDIPER